MERTKGHYGSYEIRNYDGDMPRNRALQELVKGTLTVVGVPTKLEWEEKAIPIRIPISKGLLSYKLMLIRKDDQDVFKQIKTNKELKKLVYGGGAQWSSTQAMKKLGFKVAGGTDYEDLFEMLNVGRFDFFPRGVNEVFPEYADRKDRYPELMIEQHLALYLPQPNYFFVSPLKPMLAERLQKGMRSIIDDGTFDRMFFDFYGEFISGANLDHRRILLLENVDLSNETPLNQPALWYHPGQK
ncbi:MAG: hypothetical protein ABJL55_17890 [Roseibium sp.]